MPTQPQLRGACWRTRLPGEPLVVATATQVGRLTEHAVELYFPGRIAWLPFRASEPLGQLQYVTPEGVARMKKIPKECLRPAEPHEEFCAVQEHHIVDVARELGIRLK